MDSMAMQNIPGTYDSRWFIWTIVFLVVTGISLVSYITLSDNGTNDVPPFGRVQAFQGSNHRVIKKN